MQANPQERPPTEDGTYTVTVHTYEPRPSSFTLTTFMVFHFETRLPLLNLRSSLYLLHRSTAGNRSYRQGFHHLIPHPQAS